MRDSIARALIALALSLPFVACGGADEPADDTAANTAGDESMAADDMAADEAPAADIVDTAVAAGSFNTLVAAVQAAGLEETLRGPGPFTVFAPTDEAFAALPEGTVDNLLLPENREQLVAVLTYHVVSGDVRAEQVVTMAEAPTVQGAALPINAADGSVQVGEATVVQADIETSNGVIHVIDQVLLPPS